MGRNYFVFSLARFCSIIDLLFAFPAMLSESPRTGSTPYLISNETAMLEEMEGEEVSRSCPIEVPKKRQQLKTSGESFIPPHLYNRSSKQTFSMYEHDMKRKISRFAL